jgi:acyl carrier protein
MDLGGTLSDRRIRTDLTDFVVSNYLFGDATRTPRDEDGLVEQGIIDSTGVLELIEFLESHFGIEVSEAETVPANLGSIARLARFVEVKRADAGAFLGVGGQTG